MNIYIYIIIYIYMYIYIYIYNIYIHVHRYNCIYICNYKCTSSHLHKQVCDAGQEGEAATQLKEISEK